MRLLLLAALLFIIEPSYSIRKGELPKVNKNIETKFRLPIDTKSIVFSCPVITNPDEDGVIVSWSKDGEEISNEWPKYKISENNRELKVETLAGNDEGIYTCHAVNGFGYVDVEFFLEIYDPDNDIHFAPHESLSFASKPSAPMWINKKSIDGPLYLSVRERLELLCPATGNPLPEITWLKNGQVLDMGEVHHHKSAKLQLDDVNRNDSGTYTCRLENRYGSLQDTFIVIIGGTTSLAMNKLKTSFEMSELGGEAWGGTNKNAPIIDEPQNSTVMQGQSAQFRCHISNLNNAVNPVFRWLKETNFPSAATVLTIRNKTFTILDQQANSTMSYNTKRSKVFSNTLHMPSVTKHESGRYICVITSVDGYVGYRTAQLNVISPDSQSPPLHSFVPTIILAIGIGFVLLVALAIAWLRCSTNGSEKSSTQSKSTCSTGSDCYPITFNANTGLTKNTVLSSAIQAAAPPPPPRIPAPEAPTFLQKNYMFSVHGTPTGSPLLQQDRRLRAPASVTLDRRYRPQPQQMLHRTFAEDEMSRLSSNIYDSGTPLPPPNSVLLSSSSHIYCSTSPKQGRQKLGIDPRTGYGINDNYLTMNYRDQPVFPTSSPRW